MVANSIRLYLAIEAPMKHTLPHWPVADRAAFSPLRIDGEMDRLEIGLLTFALAEQNLETVASDTAAILHQMNELDALVLSGGLIVESEGEIQIRHGCRSGLEEWRELLAILRGESPWMGHDPSPWCEFPDSEIVRFWASDHIAGKQVEPKLDISKSDVEAQPGRFHQDLMACMNLFQRWLHDLDFPGRDSLIDKFGKSFAITDDTPLAYRIEK